MSDDGADTRRQQELVAHPIDATVPLTRNEVVELSRRLSDSHDLHPHHTRAWVLVALEQFADLLARQADDGADARRVAPAEPLARVRRLLWSKFTEIGGGKCYIESNLDDLAVEILREIGDARRVAPLDPLLVTQDQAVEFLKRRARRPNDDVRSYTYLDVVEALHAFGLELMDREAQRIPAPPDAQQE